MPFLEAESCKKSDFSFDSYGTCLHFEKHDNMSVKLTLCWQGCLAKGRAENILRIKRWGKAYIFLESHLQGYREVSFGRVHCQGLDVCVHVCVLPGSVFMNVHLRRGCFRCHGKFLCSSHSVSPGSGLSLGWSYSRGPLFHSSSGRPLPCLPKIKSFSVFVLWKHQWYTSAK